MSSSRPELYDAFAVETDPGAPRGIASAISKTFEARAHLTPTLGVNARRSYQGALLEINACYEAIAAVRLYIGVHSMREAFSDPQRRQ